MDTTEMEKLRILTMWECGKSTAEIAKSINKSTRTVQRWLSHQKREGNMNRKKRGMRPRKTTPEEDARIVQLVKENPDLTQKEILTICNVNIYKGTLRRRLQEANGACKIDLYPKSKGQRPKKAKKQSVKGELASMVENTTPSATLLEQLVSPHITNQSQEIMNVKGLQYEDVTIIEQTEFIIEQQELTVHCEEEFSNQDAGHFEDGSFAPQSEGDEDSLFPMSESEKQTLTDAENVFNELMSNATQIVKVEILEQPHVGTNETINNRELSEVESVIEEDIVAESKPIPESTNRLIEIQLEENSIPEGEDNNVYEVKHDTKQRIRLKKEQKDDGITKTTSKKKRGRKRINDVKGKRKRAKTKIKRELNEKAQWVKDGKDTTEMEKAKILIMTECGMSTSDIAKSLKKSRRTVQRWLSKHNKGLAMERKERGRRPRKTTPEEDARIVQLVRENPHLSRREILALANINLHKVTLKNRLNEAGLFFNSQGIKILDYTEENPHLLNVEQTEHTYQEIQVPSHHIQLHIQSLQAQEDQQQHQEQPQLLLEHQHEPLELPSHETQCATLSSMNEYNAILY